MQIRGRTNNGLKLRLGEEGLQLLKPQDILKPSHHLGAVFDACGQGPGPIGRRLLQQFLVPTAGFELTLQLRQGHSPHGFTRPQLIANQCIEIPVQPSFQVRQQRLDVRKGCRASQGQKDGIRRITTELIPESSQLLGHCNGLLEAQAVCTPLRLPLVWATGALIQKIGKPPQGKRLLGFFLCP